MAYGTLRGLSDSDRRMCGAPARRMAFRFGSALMAGVAEIRLVALHTGFFIGFPDHGVLNLEPILGVQQLIVTSVTELLIMANLAVFGLLHSRPKVELEPVVEMRVWFPVSMARLTEIELVTSFALCRILSDLKFVVDIPAFLEMRLRFLWSNRWFFWEGRTRIESHQIGHQRGQFLWRQIGRRHD